MAFASHLGLDLHPMPGENAFKLLFNEELGCRRAGVASEDRAAFADLINRFDLTHCAQIIGKPVSQPVIRVSEEREAVVEWSWQEAFDAWWQVTHACSGVPRQS